jgi:hypothetical protein
MGRSVDAFYGLQLVVRIVLATQNEMSALLYAQQFGWPLSPAQSALALHIRSV